ncbi:putative thioesterase [Nostoc sp. CHAB 5824]|nr:putative thioesterase [Nostoc sp. CHAB 5824]
MTIIPTSDTWVIYPEPNPQASLRLFCLPYAGAGASIFRMWPSDLPTTIEVCSLQFPGRENRIRESPITQLLPLVEEIGSVLFPLLDKPFALFGHSMGGLVGFELVRWLRRQKDLTPLHLFVSGAGSPHIPDPAPPIHNLPEPKFIEELRNLNGTLEEVLKEAELMRMILPTLRSDFAVYETYTYMDEPPLDCPISVFGGLKDYQVSREHLEAWRDQTSASFSLYMLPGDHFFLHTARLLLLSKICDELYL